MKTTVIKIALCLAVFSLGSTTVSAQGFLKKLTKAADTEEKKDATTETSEATTAKKFMKQTTKVIV